MEDRQSFCFKSYQACGVTKPVHTWLNFFSELTSINTSLPRHHRHYPRNGLSTIGLWRAVTKNHSMNPLSVFRVRNVQKLNFMGGVQVETGKGNVII